MYCGANIEDLVEVLEHIHTAIPDSTLIAVGVSLGRYIFTIIAGLHNANNCSHLLSTQLIKYLSECKRLGKECYLRAILLISALWDMVESQASLSRFFNRHTLIRYLSFKYTKILKE